MAFDPIQEDCHRLVLEALRRDNIPLTDAAAVEHLMEQFTRNPARPRPRRAPHCQGGRGCRLPHSLYP